MKIKSFGYKRIEFVNIKRIKVVNEYFYTGKIYLRGCSQLKHYKAPHINFKYQARTLKELKRFLKGNYDEYFGWLWS